MKRLLALIAGGLGLGAFWRRRARPGLSPSPADDLRAKLAAARSETGEPDAAAAPVVEPAAVEPSEAPAAEADDVAARRADVHEKARRALDELK